MAECWRIEAFELWCWRRLLRVPCTASRSNQSIPKEINTDCWKDWCWSSNTLATWCKKLTHWKRLWCWERMKAGGEGDNRGWDGWMASQTGSTWVWASSRSWWWTGRPGVLQSMGSQRVGRDWATELNWTAISSSRGSSWRRDASCVSCTGKQILYCWATGKPQEVWQLSFILCPIFSVSFRKKFAAFLLIQSHLYSQLLWRWLIKFMIHTSPNSLIKWWFSHTLSCLMRISFPRILQ